MEVWRDVVTDKCDDPDIYKGVYQVSSKGRVRSLDRALIDSLGSKKGLRGRTLSPVDIKGYSRVSLCVNKEVVSHMVHRLVALAFLPNTSSLPAVNHKDGDKTNNTLDNLEWCSHSENMLHAFDSGLQPSGEDHSQSKLTNKQVTEIRRLCSLEDSKGKRKHLQKDIAELFNVSAATISVIINHKKRKRG